MLNVWIRGDTKMKRKKPEDRFLEKVNKNATNGCWEWTSAFQLKGYGMFWFQNKHTHAHRISWLLTNGEIPKGLSVCHRCDNRKCVNPDHLFLGTQKDNIQDCVKKGRAIRSNGNNHYCHKLKEENIHEIVYMFHNGYSSKKIAKIFNVSPSTIRKVVNNKTWKHVDRMEIKK
jgi:hypothetical protein